MILKDRGVLGWEENKWVWKMVIGQEELVLGCGYKARPT